MFGQRQRQNIVNTVLVIKISVTNKLKRLFRFADFVNLKKSSGQQFELSQCEQFKQFQTKFVENLKSIENFRNL